MASKNSRKEKLDTSSQVRLLTPSEYESLRQDMKDSSDLASEVLKNHRELLNQEAPKWKV